MDLPGLIMDSINEDKPFFIVFYGPSTTSVENVFPNWAEIIRYVLKDHFEETTGDYMKAYWNIQTANLGLNGASSLDLLERFDVLIRRTMPDLLFLCAGKNDCYYGYGEVVTQKNTTAIIQEALSHGIKVVLTTAIPSLSIKLNERMRGHIEADRIAAEKFSQNENFLFLDLFRLFPRQYVADSYTLISEDGNSQVGYAPGERDPIHPNRLGNALIAEIILKEAFRIDFNSKKFLKNVADMTKKYPEY